MADFPRLIEYAFPLKQASLDSVHEKNVRHGHISTLHIWPARRPLAACRAALIATLLPDPGDPEKRRELCEKIGGKVVKKIEKKKMPSGQTVERIKEETVGGILHWGQETENVETLQWFRDEIRKVYGGRAPKVLDPFAGGGAIPLEAMRLGCEATAVDINPVAWFVLKCTLEYPQKLAGQTRELPEFILHNNAFMAEFFKNAKGYGKAETKAAIKRLHDRYKKTPKAKAKEDQASLQFLQEAGDATNELQADLAWHVRAWGQWVLDRARRELAQYYPTYADFEPIMKDHVAYEHQPMRLVSLREDGTPDIDSLNGEFTEDYLADKRNPRWVAKPTLAYLWARVIPCKNCRASIPLLKTSWLARKGQQRIRLSIDASQDRSIEYSIENNVPVRGGNPAQRREHDKKLGVATMSRAGARCPCCGTIMTTEDVRVAGRGGTLTAKPVATVVQGTRAKEYRVVTPEEHDVLTATRNRCTQLAEALPFGPLNEPIPQGASRSTGGSPFTVHIYGMTEWGDLYTPRQMASLASLAMAARDISPKLDDAWVEAIRAYIGLLHDRLVNTMTTNCTWNVGSQSIRGTYARYALPITWDFVELNPLSEIGAAYDGAAELITSACTFVLEAGANAPTSTAKRASVLDGTAEKYDLIVTDPPYYDAIPYSDLMDLFYVWLRRIMHGISPEADEAFAAPLAPKWNHDRRNGELIDDPARYGGSRTASKQAYEEGMARAFESCRSSLSDDGRLVIVFAHKHPDAWETLVGALIRSGFVVDSSWPIQTEREARTRALTSAALASSVWMVCKKRPATARPGWDNHVLDEMKANIAVRLREYWDAGIRGPDFVWAATGPAMEAYSKHPVVRKANEPNATMGVSEFLNHVRRMVVDYVVGQVLTGEQGSDLAAADRLDEVTAYYLLHRHDFGLDEAPVGACILYATACSLSDAELDKTWDILARTGGNAVEADEDNNSDDAEDSDGDAEPSEDASGASKVKLKPWNQRRGKSMGYEAPEGRVVPLIDRIHRVMHLWKDGDVQKVDDYLDQHALRRNELFKRVVQSLIELSTNSERALLESISNHIGAKGAVKDRGPELPFGDEE